LVGDESRGVSFAEYLRPAKVQRVGECRAWFDSGLFSFNNDISGEFAAFTCIGFVSDVTTGDNAGTLLQNDLGFGFSGLKKRLKLKLGCGSRHPTIQRRVQQLI
jgi:hypothetical protein